MARFPVAWKEYTEGWQITPEKIEVNLKHDPEILTLWREAMKQQSGQRTDLVSNINEVKGRSAGNTKSYTLSRLKREFPELYQSVCEEKMAANQAAIQAGIPEIRPTVRD